MQAQLNRGRVGALRDGTVASGLLLTEEFLNLIMWVLANGNIRMKTSEEHRSSEIIWAHLRPKIARVPVEDHLLDGGHSHYMCLSSVHLRDGKP